MSNYRVRETGGVHTQGEIRRMNPNVSLPRVWTQATLEGLGVDPVLEGEKPEAGEYEVVVKDAVTQVNGNWTQQYKTAPMFSEYMDENGNAVTVQQQIEDYESSKLQKRREAMTVSNKDLRLALNEEGVYGDVEGAMAKSTNTTELEIHWNFSTTINRLDPWVTEVAQALDMSDEQLDELFSKAAGEA